MTRVVGTHPATETWFEMKSVGRRRLVKSWAGHGKELGINFNTTESH